MNDNELATMVRESVADVHSATPIAQIISRGRAVRARRRTPALAGAGAVLAGTALAVTTLVPSGHSEGPNSGHQGSRPAGARLAAWTVAKQANGDIDVTINQLQNPAGLQSTLRADGLPVNVTFFSQSVQSWTPPCQLYPVSGDVLNAVVHFPNSGSTAGGTDFLVIKPSALPPGAGLAILAGEPTLDPLSGKHGNKVGVQVAVGPGPSMPPSMPPGTASGVGQGMGGRPGDPRLVVGVFISPVYASQRCTG